MSAQAVQGSPTKANRIPYHSNLLAKQEHLNTDRAITPRPMHGYIEDAKKLLEKRATEVLWRGNTSAWDAISRDPAVNVAFAALLPVLENKVEETHYAPTTQLLNRISLAVYKLLRQKESRDCAHIFASNRNRAPGGDMHGTRSKPDYITYLGKLSDLEDAVGQADHERDLPWPEIGHVGEDKAPDNDDDGMAQLKSYLRQLKESRPDIPTVHGFKVYQSRITFALLNACDMWTTTAMDCGKLDPWIAFVVMLYSLHGIKDRNPDLRYNAQQLDFVRWDVLGSARRQEYALSPFYVARAPGRVTFASFRIVAGPTSIATASRAYFVHEAKGFWKLSWQQTSARSREKDLLQSLHSKGWLPGLVRLHEDDDEYTPMTVSSRIKPAHGSSGASAASTAAAPEPIVADSIPAPESTATESAPAPQPTASSSDRALEILHLASIGEPLSQLESPRALIHAFYDLLETLVHMYEEGVLHRDVSWFNVLYKGKHYTSNRKIVQKRPCLAEILHGVRAQDTQPSISQSKPEFSPSILVTDLDHAIERVLLEKDAKAGREKTGTPMFMAVELSDYSQLVYKAGGGFIPDLKRAFVATEEIPEAALRIAFPKGDNNFMVKFLAVMKAERERDDAYPLPSKPPHRPRHDAESAFWVFFWAAVRALPRHASLQPAAPEVDAFTAFCDKMLDHVIDDEKTDVRADILTATTYARIFHPALKPFVGLFETMAHYLALPWHYYEAEEMVDSNHAYVAFRRLLLHFELKLEADNPAMLDLKFNTEHPRVMVRKVGDGVERASALQGSRLSHVRASGRESPLSGFPETGGSTSSKKRKANESTDLGTGSSKKPATKKASASETAEFSVPDDDDQGDPAPDYHAVAGVTYNEVDHFYKRTAHALRLKFLKDRQLWFSRGA